MKTISLACALAVAATLMTTLAKADDPVAIISQYRREHGLPAVKMDPRMTAVAERQAHAMAASGIMDHDVAGSFSSRIAAAGTNSAGENIAAGTKTWADTIRMWERSPGHDANLLLGDADIIGVAVARNEQTRYKVFWSMAIGHRAPPGSRAKHRVAESGHGETTWGPSAPEWLTGILSASRRALFGE
jgi:uncharacterized protein YkwD